MLREPGPIPPLDTSWYPTTYDTPDFTDMVATALADADSIFGSMDALFDPTAAFDEVLTGDTILADLDTVDQINGDNAHLANLSGIPVIDGYKADGDAAILAAYDSTPGEAFFPVPAASPWATAAPQASTVRIAALSISQDSDPSAPAITVGQAFTIVVRMDMSTGHTTDYYGVTITLDAYHDGISQPTVPLGKTDATGILAYHAQAQRGDAGNWSATITATTTLGGAAYAPLSWSVVPVGHTPAAPGPPGVAVAFQNLTSGNSAALQVGDTWLLNITGPPNADVSVWATHDGVALGTTSLGSTDAQGNFTLSRTLTDAEIGNWVEHYSVGGFEWRSALQFTVAPAS